MMQGRSLLVIPIMHTDTEAEIPINQKRESVVRSYWEEVRSYLLATVTEPSELVVYQDSLPDFPEEDLQHFIDSMTDIDSINYEILHWLQSKGARIVGTEDPQLVVEHSHFIQHYLALEAEGQQVREEYLKGDKIYVTKRDQYIARRIDQTLPPGKVGLLFIGVAHRPWEYLPGDIEVGMPERLVSPLIETRRLKNLYSKER